MFVKKCIPFVLTIVLVLSFLLASCSQQATSSTSAAKPAQVSSQFSPALKEVIEGAKKEGQVTVMLDGEWGSDGWTRVEKEIKDMFGVDLKITYTPTKSGGQTLTQLLTEKKSGVASQCDLTDFTTSKCKEAATNAAVENVDWRTLLTKEMNPDVVFDFGGIQWLSIKSQATGGMVYNPEKIAANELPKTLTELANNPKWFGKIGYVSFTGVWGRWAHDEGKEVVYAAIRKMQENKSFLGTGEEIYNRYKIGEVWALLTQDYYVEIANKDKVPAAWQHFSLYQMNETVSAIPYNAKNKNAAKLVALYLSSPEGIKFTDDVSSQSCYLYSGNFEYNSLEAAKKAGVRIIFTARDKGAIAYEESAEFAADQKEVTLVLQGK